MVKVEYTCFVNEMKDEKKTRKFNIDNFGFVADDDYDILECVFEKIWFNKLQDLHSVKINDKEYIVHDDEEETKHGALYWMVFFERRASNLLDEYNSCRYDHAKFKIKYEKFTNEQK